MVDNYDTSDQQGTAAKKAFSQSPGSSVSESVGSGDQGIDAVVSAAASTQEAKKTNQELDRIRRGELWVIGLNSGLFIVGAVVCIIYGLQLSVMKSQLQVMQDTLAEMRASGKESGKQTDQIIEQARTQAGAAKTSADAAKTSADNSVTISKAAAKNVSVSQEAMRLDQRAWVGITGVTLKSPIQPDQQIEISTNYINTGKTPALNTSGYAEAMLLASEAQIENMKIVPPLAVFKTTLFPGGAVHFSKWIQPLPQPLINDLNRGASRIFVYGRINYSDVFDRKHWTDFCLTYTPEVQGFVYCHTGNKTDDSE